MSAYARLAFLAIVAALLIASTIAIVRAGSPERQSFKAFYCAGAAVNQRADPYRVEPLRGCEQQVARGTMVPGAVEPAPLPGYALALFALLSRLPVTLAAMLFSLAIAAAGIASALLLARMTGYAAALILLALSPLLLLNVAYGETPPFALLAICASGFLIWARRPHAAGVAAACALIQPNVALPALLALLVFVPKARTSIVVSIAVLTALSAATIGVEKNVEYLRSVLPVQAWSELIASDQYSVSRVLFEAGVAPSLALRIGQLAYAVAIVLSLVLAYVVARRSQRYEAYALIPPAIALLGGVYLHDIQFIVALPAAIFVLSLSRSSAYIRFAALAALLLAVVWTQRPGRAVIAVNAAAVAAVASLSIRRRSMRAAIGATAIVVAFVTGSFAVRALGHAAAPDDPPVAISALPSELAPFAWERYLRSDPDLTRPLYVPKLPTWAALVLLVIVSPASAASLKRA
ncbi:MAG TPA: glycosyltransferase 87 family protein [Candidatus Aquilonibacter sp.]|nr:glycosyltransferase 87 family protein [Candidatus Aquilonibacter sp.]